MAAPSRAHPPEGGEAGRRARLPAAAVVALAACVALGAVHGAHAQQPDALPKYASQFNISGADGPPGLAADAALNSTHMFVADGGNHRVLVFDSAGNRAGTFGSFGADAGRFDSPSGIALNSTHIFVADTRNHRVQIFDMTGNHMGMLGDKGDLRLPSGIALNSTHVFVADMNGARVRVFDASGNHTGTFYMPGGDVKRYNALAGLAHNSTHTFAADTHNNRIQIFDSAGNDAGTLGSFGTGPGQFSFPVGIAHNSTHTFAADRYGDRVHIFDASGNHTGTLGAPGTGPGQFRSPTGLAHNSTHLLVVDTRNDRVQTFRAGGAPAATDPDAGAEPGGAEPEPPDADPGGGEPVNGTEPAGAEPVRSRAGHAMAEKLYMLDLINAERRSRGLDPVALGGNPAAQLHADSALTNCFSSHWGLDGLKPYMRYSLAGGHQNNAENVAGLAHCIVEDDNYLPISILDELSKTMDGFMSSPGHRANILNPHHAAVNLGIAWDEYNVHLVQHFEHDYVAFDEEPAIRDGVLSLSGTAVNGAGLPPSGDMNVFVHHDPPPHGLTLGQLARTVCYGLGDRVALLASPPPPGYSYSADSVRQTVRPCPDPYDVPQNATAPRSPDHAHQLLREAQLLRPLPETIVVPYIIAAGWDVSGNDFSVSADVRSLLEERGPGVYTVTVWGRAGSGDVVISQYPIFHGTDRPVGYD